MFTITIPFKIPQHNYYGGSKQKLWRPPGIHLWSGTIHLVSQRAVISIPNHCQSMGYVDDAVVIVTGLPMQTQPYWYCGSCNKGRWRRVFLLGIRL